MSLNNSCVSASNGALSSSASSASAEKVSSFLPSNPLPPQGNEVDGEIHTPGASKLAALAANGKTQVRGRQQNREGNPPSGSEKINPSDEFCSIFSDVYLKMTAAATFDEQKAILERFLSEIVSKVVETVPQVPSAAAASSSSDSKKSIDTGIYQCFTNARRSVEEKIAEQQGEKNGQKIYGKMSFIFGEDGNPILGSDGKRLTKTVYLFKLEEFRKFKSAYLSSSFKPADGVIHSKSRANSVRRSHSSKPGAGSSSAVAPVVDEKKEVKKNEADARAKTPGRGRVVASVAKKEEKKEEKGKNEAGAGSSSVVAPVVKKEEVDEMLIQMIVDDCKVEIGKMRNDESKRKMFELLEKTMKKQYSTEDKVNDIHKIAAAAKRMQ
jgi:hypothetical protein